MSVWYRWRRISVLHVKGAWVNACYDPDVKGWEAVVGPSDCGADYRSRCHDNIADAVSDAKAYIDRRKAERQEIKRQWRKFRKTEKGAC